MASKIKQRADPWPHTESAKNSPTAKKRKGKRKPFVSSSNTQLKLTQRNQKTNFSEPQRALKAIQSLHQCGYLSDPIQTNLHWKKNDFLNDSDIHQHELGLEASIKRSNQLDLTCQNELATHLQVSYAQRGSNLLKNMDKTFYSRRCSRYPTQPEHHENRDALSITQYRQTAHHSRKFSNPKQTLQCKKIFLCSESQPSNNQKSPLSLSFSPGKQENLTVIVSKKSGIWKSTPLKREIKLKTKDKNASINFSTELDKLECIKISLPLDQQLKNRKENAQHYELQREFVNPLIDKPQAKLDYPLFAIIKSMNKSKLKNSNPSLNPVVKKQKKVSNQKSILKYYTSSNFFVENPQYLKRIRKRNHESSFGVESPLRNLLKLQSYNEPENQRRNKE